MVLSKSMGRLRYCLIFAALSLVFVASGYAQTSTLRVFVDQSKAIQIKNLKRVSITNPRIADVVIVSPHELIVNGLNIGRTTLYLWDDKGRKEVQVVVLEDRADIPRLIRNEVKKVLDLDTVDVRVIQMENRETLILRGVVDSETQIDIVEEIAKAYFEGTIMNLLEAKADYISIEDQLRKMIKEPEVKITVIYEGRRVFKRGEMPRVRNIILEGFVDDQYDNERIEAIASSFDGSVTNLIEVVNPVQILIEAHVLELAKSNEDRLGIGWGTTVGGTSGANNISFGERNPNTVRFLENLYYSWRGDVRTLGPRIDPQGSFPWEFENLNRVDPMYAKLNFDIQRNKAKVLASPKVITQADTSAEIRVGGQIPVPGESEGGGVAIEYKTYGLQMSISPSVNHKAQITSKIDLTWTTIDPSEALSIGGDRFTALKERSSSNEVTVGDGQHVIISGLIQEEEGKVASGIPVLRRIPVLGKLFQSTEFTKSKTELVIIVTPSLLASKRIREKYNQPDLRQRDMEGEDEMGDEEPISFDDVDPDQAEKLQVALSKVDSTFDKILNREELTVTPVDIPPLKIMRPSTELDIAASGEATRAGRTEERLAAPSLSPANEKKSSSKVDDFTKRVRERLRRAKLSNADSSSSKRDVSRRARLEEEIRKRVRQQAASYGQTPDEAKSLFPEDAGEQQPLEARLQSIITEFPDDSSLPVRTSATSGEIASPAAGYGNDGTATKHRRPSSVGEAAAAANSASSASAANAASSASAAPRVDEEVDHLFLQIKEKLANKGD